jgi:hypothetical protein
MVAQPVGCNRPTSLSLIVASLALSAGFTIFKIVPPDFSSRMADVNKASIGAAALLHSEPADVEIAFHFSAVERES